MDPRLLAVVALRSLAQLYALQGNTKAAGAMQFTANAVEAGRAVDEHMRNVAAALNDDSLVSWDDVHNRIAVESNELRNRDVEG